MEEGAIIHVDYDLFSVDTGDLIETTRERIEVDPHTHLGSSLSRLNRRK